MKLVSYINYLFMLFCFVNVRFIRNKFLDIFDYICEWKIDFCVIIEIWLCFDDDVIRVEMCFIGYKFFD